MPINWNPALPEPRDQEWTVAEALLIRADGHLRPDGTEIIDTVWLLATNDLT